MEVINDIMMTCCILYNMVVEDEKDVTGFENILIDLQKNNLPAQRGLSFDDLMARTIDVQNEDTHFSLKEDPIKLVATKGLGQPNLINKKFAFLTHQYIVRPIRARLTFTCSSPSSRKPYHHHKKNFSIHH